MMSVGHMSMVPSLFMTACFVMICGSAVVLCCVLVVLRGLAVMVRVILRHGMPPAAAYDIKVNAACRIVDIFVILKFSIKPSIKDLFQLAIQLPVHLPAVARRNRLELPPRSIRAQRMTEPAA